MYIEKVKSTQSFYCLPSVVVVHTTERVLFNTSVLMLTIGIKLKFVLPLLPELETLVEKT